jgi:molybdopterin-guanine dinucleotide biosynthesis protein
MIKRIFAVSGVKDSGKTHTLNYLAQLLESTGSRIDGPNPMTHPLNTDTQYVFEVKGHRVGVGTSGDDGWIIDEHFNKFDAAGCDVVIVACRSRTGTASVDALERQAISRGHIVDYTTLMWNASLPRLIVVEQDIARRIASRI